MIGRLGRSELALGALATGYMIARSYRPPLPKLHASLHNETALIAWNRGLLVSLSALADVVSEDDLRRIVALLDEFRRYDVYPSRVSPAHMNRLMRAIHEAIRRSIRPRESATVEDLRRSLHVEEDVVPSIVRQVETILHNHMMDRSLV